MHTTAKRFIKSASISLLIFLLSHPAYAHKGGYDAKALSYLSPVSTPQTQQTLLTLQTRLQQQEFSRVFGQEANKLVGDISKKAEWKDGSTEKMILHAIVGAVQANLGGGDMVAGGLSGLTSEAVIPIMEQVLQNNGIQKGTSEYNSLMQLASTVVGGAAGAIVSGGNTEGIGSGAATALSNIQNNYLKHPEIKEKVKLDEQCARGNQQACADAKRLQNLSDDRDKELKEACGSNGNPAECGQLQQVVRYAYAEIIRKGPEGLNVFAYRHYAGETEYQADTTLSKSDQLRACA